MQTPAERQAAYRARHPSRVKASRKAQYKRVRVAQAAYKAVQRRLHPEVERGRVWRATGRPTPTRQRPELCECCGQPERSKSRKVLCNDHDHASKAFRGWICSRCNTAIGLLGDTIDGVLRALDYLARA
jgi:Recombination endonuclease VII